MTKILSNESLYSSETTLTQCVFSFWTQTEENPDIIYANYELNYIIAAETQYRRGKKMKGVSMD